MHARPRRRQPADQRGADRWNEADLWPQREVAVDDPCTQRRRELLAIAGGGHIDALDLGLLRSHVARLEFRIDW